MMATLDIEDRKRPLDIESLNNPTSTAKRPHLDRASSSFTSNGHPGVKRENLETLGDEEDSIPAYKGLEVSLRFILPYCPVSVAEAFTPGFSQGGHIPTNARIEKGSTKSSRESWKARGSNGCNE